MFSAIILAGGKGERLNLGYNKVLYKIKGKTILEYATEKFIVDKYISEIIIVIDKENYNKINKIFPNKKIKIITGGENRQSSVSNGLKEVTNDFVIIHDGARPNVSFEEIKTIKENVKNGPCILYTNIKEATVEIEDKKVRNYINRDKLALIKTPQGFNTNDLIKAYKLASKNNNVYLDDASLLFYELNKEITILKGKDRNIKITSKFDLEIMEDLL
ncbi:MAG: IspD/TarI family cytidylyltransferase [Bacillota bacterium]